MKTAITQRVSTYGFGLFSILILSRWITGNALFAAPESMLRFGFIGALTFAVSGCMAFIVLIPLVKRLRQYTKETEILAILEERLTSEAFTWMKRLMTVAVYFGMISIGLAVSLLIYSTFGLPIPIGFSFFFIVGWTLVALGNLEWFTSFNVIKVGLLLLVMVMILIYAYMFEGIETVFKGVRLYHPYLFFIESDRVPSLFATVFLALLGSLMLDGKTWGVLLKANVTKLRRGLITTGLVWSTIPFGFSMMVIASIYLGGFDDIFSIFQLWMHRYDSWITILLLFIVLYVILLDTFWTQVRSLKMLNGSPFPKKAGHTALILLTFIVLLPVVIYFTAVTVLDLFFFFGIFFASSIPVIGEILWWKRDRPTGMVAPITIGVGTLCGWVTYTLGYDYQGVLVGFGVVVIILILGRVILTKRSV